VHPGHPIIIAVVAPLAPAPLAAPELAAGRQQLEGIDGIPLVIENGPRAAEPADLDLLLLALLGARVRGGDELRAKPAGSCRVGLGRLFGVKDVAGLDHQKVILAVVRLSLGCFPRRRSWRCRCCRCRPVGAPLRLLLLLLL
jgi:hypothetical protein